MTPNVRGFTAYDDAGRPIGVYLDHPGEECAFDPDTLQCPCGRLNLGVVPDPDTHTCDPRRCCSTCKRHVNPHQGCVLR
jgi:hypothetical protein